MIPSRALCGATGPRRSTPRRRASTLRDIAAPRDQGFVSQFK
jgi:hypothetical protein